MMNTTDALAQLDAANTMGGFMLLGFGIMFAVIAVAWVGGMVLDLVRGY